MVAGVGIKEKEWKCRKAKWITSWLVKMVSKSPACYRIRTVVVVAMVTR